MAARTLAELRRGLRIAPAPVARGEVVGGDRPPRPGLIHLDPRGRVEQRLHDSPRLLDHPPAREERAVPTERIGEKPLVRLRRLAELLGEVEIEGDGPRDLLAWSLRAQEDRDSSVPAYAKHDVVVSRGVEAMPPPLQVRDALESDDDLRRSPGKRLSRSNQDRHPRPAPVLDLELERDE